MEIRSRVVRMKHSHSGNRRFVRTRGFLYRSVHSLRVANQSPRRQPRLAPTLVRVSLPLQGGSYGTIKGRLIWGGDQAPGPASSEGSRLARPNPIPRFAQPSLPIADDSLIVDPKTLGVRDGIVWLMRPKGTNPDALKGPCSRKTPTVEFDQKGLCLRPACPGDSSGSEGEIQVVRPGQPQRASQWLQERFQFNRSRERLNGSDSCRRETRSSRSSATFTPG